MRKTLALSFALLVAAVTNAQQFKFSPKWQVDKTINLEYVYSDHEDKKGEHKFDTINADIQLKLVSEDDNFYFFDWSFLNYYQDITDNSSTTKKITGPVIAKFVTQIPIKFRVEKVDWEIKVLNEKAIDSLKEIAVKEYVAAMPDNSDKDDFLSAEAVLDLSVSLQMEKKIYGLLNDYFAVYKQEKLVLNEKKDLADEMSQSDKKDVSKILGGYEAYTLLDDKNAAYYNFHMEVKMDMSKMMNMFAEMAKDLDKDKKKKGKKNETPDMPSAPIVSVTAVDIKVEKANMLVQSYTQVITMDGKDSWMETSGNAHKVLRVKK